MFCDAALKEDDKLARHTRNQVLICDTLPEKLVVVVRQRCQNPQQRLGKRKENINNLNVSIRPTMLLETAYLQITGACNCLLPAAAVAAR